MRPHRRSRRAPRIRKHLCGASIERTLSAIVPAIAHQTTRKRSLAGMTGATEARPLCLHVYRVGGIWSDDRTVKADDRKTPRYYLKGTRLQSSWRFVLHAGGPSGAVVCRVKSPYVGPPLAGNGPGPISITIGWERHPVQVRRGKSSGGMCSFSGLDDEEYRWRPISRSWGSTMECLNSQDHVVATYRMTPFAISKDGELCIYQPVQFMTDLLVATCLAMRMPDH